MIREKIFYYDTLPYPTLMINHLKLKSEFSRNLLTLMTGTTIAQAIPIAISPILTRIYTPEDFGVLALYLAISSIIGVIVTGRYELAIMLPKKKSDAEKLVLLSLIITIVISLITLMVVVVFNQRITQLLGSPRISQWLYFVPLTIFFTGVYQSFNYWSNRQKRYKNLVASRVTQSTVNSGVQLGAGIEGITQYGLISGNIIGQGIASLLLAKIILKKNNNFFKINRAIKLIALLKRYKKLPLYSAPMGFVNSISNQIKPLVFSSIFSTGIVGWVFMAERMLRAPLSIISSSFGEVFFQKFVNSDNKLNIYIKSYFLLLLLSLFFLSPILFWGELIFEKIFGIEWKEAGKVASIMYPMVCISFATSAISSIFTAMEINEISLLWQIIYFIGLVFIITFFYNDGYIVLMKYLVYWGSGMYFILFLVGGYCIKIK